jgi:hypothetical protein
MVLVTWVLGASGDKNFMFKKLKFMKLINGGYVYVGL